MDWIGWVGLDWIRVGLVGLGLDLVLELSWVWFSFGWIGLDWIGLGLVGLVWIRFGLGWVGLGLVWCRELRINSTSSMFM